MELGFEPRACIQSIFSLQAAVRGLREAREVWEALWVGTFLEEGPKEPGLQVAGRVRLCGGGVPSALQSTSVTGKGSQQSDHGGVVVTAGPLRTGSCREPDCKLHTAVSTYYVPGKAAVQEVGWGHESSQTLSGQCHLATQRLSSIPGWALGPGSATFRR